MHEPDPLSGARRVLVYGVTGSGKTTAAARISEATGIPWTAVDDQTHEADWVVVPEDVQRRRFAELCAGDSWLLDSAYGAWLDVVLPRAELVVALDYPRWVSLQRLVRCSLARAWDKQLICNGNTETWRQLFSRSTHGSTACTRAEAPGRRVLSVRKRRVAGNRDTPVI